MNGVDVAQNINKSGALNFHLFFVNFNALYKSQHFGTIFSNILILLNVFHLLCQRK